MSTQRADLSLEKLCELLPTVLKQWAEKGDPTPTLAQLQLFQQALHRSHGNAVLALDDVLEQGLAALARESERHALVLRLRFGENRKAYDVANYLNMAESSLYNVQRVAIQRLTELLFAQEERLRNATQASLLHRLEAPTYTELIGTEETVGRLFQQVMTPAAPWVIALEGMGGIGKTSLANALMRQIITQTSPFVDIGWVTARQAHYDPAGKIVAEARPALTTDALIATVWQQLFAATVAEAAFSHEQKLQMLITRCKQQPHLIVIDNLESVRDVDVLLPLLHALVNPTKFLLTSRERCGAVGLFHFTVPSLSEADSIRLVQREAALSNLIHLADADPVTLRPIYETVGGNPLALRLVVGQTHVHTLDAILADLRLARGAKVEQLYTYLYRRAWEQLDEVVREVWLALPLLTPAHATLTHLARLTELGEQPLRTAIEQLVLLNLVNCHGPLQERYYTLHNLTRTFLQEQVAQWA